MDKENKKISIYLKKSCKIIHGQKKKQGQIGNFYILTEIDIKNHFPIFVQHYKIENIEFWIEDFNIFIL